MTQTEICTEHGISRQTLHALRTNPAAGFPDGIVKPGSTRPKWRRADVAAYFEAHPKRPGVRRSVQPPTTEPGDKP